MSLLNPYAFTPFGQPVAPGVNMLCAIGAPASAGQLDAARSVFSRFCSQTQLSAAPNQTAIGRLPDGTQYKIAVVGAMTTMTVWPLSTGKGRVMNPGIGVTTAAGHWILRPPGQALKPGSGKWAIEKVDAISGGAVYVFTADDYFVESATGLSQNNSRVADSIHGAGGSRYVAASNTFGVSNLFLAGDAVKQLKISGDTLKLGARDLEDGVPDATLITSTHDLPEMSAGDWWGMVSSNATGKLIAVCRAEADPDAPPEGKIGSRVCAVAHMKAGPPPKGAARPPNTLVEVTSVQSLTPVVVERAPNLASDKAPVTSEWSETKEEEDSISTISLANPNPYSPNRTIDLQSRTSLRKYGYEEEARFESTSTYRAYVGAAGALIVDGLKRRDHALITSASDNSFIGYEEDIYADWERKNSGAAKVIVERSEELLLGSELGVKSYALKIDYEALRDGDRRVSSQFSHYVYNEGGIKGFIFVTNARAADLTTVKCNISRIGETVLLFDDQFKVVVTAKVSLTLDHTSRDGMEPQAASDASGQTPYFMDVLDAAYNAGMPQLPRVHETETTVKCAVTLEVLHGGARSSAKLDAPAWLEEEGGDALRLLLYEVIATGGIVRAMRPEDDPEATEGVRPNRFFREYGLTEVVEAVFLQQLGDVMYAKDPKTGAGFLSFVWAGKPYNYVVGPWGVAPSSSRTTIAKDAAISALQSV